jgi:hypothetical protein
LVTTFGDKLVSLVNVPDVFAASNNLVSAVDDKYPKKYLDENKFLES